MILDRGHPLARGLSHAWIWDGAPGSTFRDIAGGSHAVPVTGATWGVAPRGRRSLLLASGYANCGVLPGLAGATSATMIFGGFRVNNAEFAVGDGESFGNDANIIITSNLAYTQIGSGSMAQGYVSATTGDFNLGWIFDGSQSGWNRVVPILNGTLTSYAYTTGTPPAAIVGTGVWSLGREQWAGRLTTGRIDYCLLWIGRKLTAGDVKSVTDDPYQLFASMPRRARFAASAAAPSFLPAWAARSQNLGVGVY